jgi:hypothetical protein
LPECIAPKRWYLWKEQEDCLKACFNGVSTLSIAKQLLPSRQTIRRWVKWTFDRFKEFRPELQSRFSILGYESELFGWWKKLLETIRLSGAMLILNRLGINVLRSLGDKKGGPTLDSS